MSFPVNTLIGGRYIIKGMLGEGGMANVYLAEHKRLGTSWAIKEMKVNFTGDPHSQKQFARAIEQFNIEAKILACLDHPNLPKVIDFFDDKGSYFIVMEYIQGETLEEIYMEKRQGFLPEAMVLDWSIQICEALVYLHNQDPHPVIFRDLKPKNVMLSRKDNLIKLIDFGIAKIFEPDGKTHTIIRGAGTVGFSPPEQYGTVTTDARTDIYSLGATMYVLLTEHIPPNSIDRVISRVELTPPAAINSVISPALEACILKAMELSRNNRYQTAEEMLGDLNYCLKKPVHLSRSESQSRMPLLVERKPVKKTKRSASVTRKATLKYTFQTKWGRQGGAPGEFYGPNGIAVVPSENIYVVDTLNHRVQKFDLNGRFIKTWGTEGTDAGQFNYPEGIAIDGMECIYVADRDNSRIQVFDPEGNFIRKIEAKGIRGMIQRLMKLQISSYLKAPYEIALDSSNNIYVTDTYNHCVYKFDENGSLKVKWGEFGSGEGEFYSPKGISVNSSGFVYVADYGNDRVQKFDSDGKFITAWGENGAGNGEFSYPSGIAIDFMDYVYVVDYENDRVQKFDSSGNFLMKWGERGTRKGEFTYPCGIAIDDRGYVYVTDSDNHRVQKFSPL